MAGTALGRSGSANKANMLAADDAKRMQALEGKVTEQKKELENRDITIRAIQRNFEQLSSMCQADKEQIQVLQKKLAEAEKKTVSSEERERAAKYPKLKDAFDSLNNMYVDTEDKMSKLQKQLTAALANSDKGDSEKKKWLAQIEEGKRALEESQRKLADAQRTASGWESKRSVMDEKLKELQDALKAKEKMRADLEKSETTLRAEMSRLQAQMMKAESSAQKETRELAKKLAESENARLSSSKAGAELQEAKKASAAYQKQLQEMHSLLEKATSKAGETSAKLEESYRQLSQIEGDVVREKKAGAEWERKLKMLQGEKEGSGLEAQKREEDLEKRVAGLQEEIAALQVQMSEKKDELVSKEKILKEATSKATGLEHSNAQLEAKVSHLHDQNEFWEEEGKKLKDRIKELQGTVQSQENELRRYRQQTEELGAASGEAAAANAQLQTLKDKFERELAQVQKALDKAQRDIEAAGLQRDKALKLGEALESKLAAAEAQIQKLQSGAEGQSEMAAQITKLKDQLEKREANLSRSENIIKKLMAEVEEHKRG